MRTPKATAGWMVSLALTAAACSTGQADVVPTSTSSPGGASTIVTAAPANPSRTSGASGTTTGSASSVPTEAAPNPPATTGPSTSTTRPTPPSPPSSGGSPAARPAGIITVLPTATKVVALTFDGGADSRGAPSILATLRRENVPATFFVTGSFVTAYPSLVADLGRVGPVGNHSWDHPHFPALTDGQLAGQLDRTRASIMRATSADPIPFFRFPFGDSDARTRAAVAARGYLAIGWTVDSLGWKGTSGGMTATSVADRVVAAARPGEIVLLHLGANPDDNSTLDADALPQIISRLRAKGYTFGTLDSLR